MISWTQQFMSFFQKTHSSAEWQLFKFDIWWFNKKRDIKYFFLCRNGWHKYRPVNCEISKGKRITKFAYIECCVCGAKFFPTVKEAHKFFIQTRKERRLLRGLL